MVLFTEPVPVFTLVCVTLALLWELRAQRVEIAQLQKELARMHTRFQALSVWPEE